MDNELSALRVIPAKTTHPYRKSERTKLLGSAFGTAPVEILYVR